MAKLRRPSRKTIWKWTKRSLIGLLVLAALSVVGFELWRQNEISNADTEFDVALADLKQDTAAGPTYDEFRDSLRHGRDGTQAFKDFLMQCFYFGQSNFSADRNKSPLEDQEFLDRAVAGNLTQDDRAGLAKWLQITQPLMDDLTSVAEYDCIVLDQLDDDFHAHHSKFSSIYLFGLTGLGTVLSRYKALAFLGNSEQARSEVDIYQRVARALSSSSSSVQLLFYQAFKHSIRDSISYQLIYGDIDSETISLAQQYDMDDYTVLANSATGALLAARDHPDEFFSFDKYNSEIRSDWWAWLNLANYERFNRDEFLHNAIIYPLFKRSWAAWFDWTQQSIVAYNVQQRPAEGPTYLLWGSKFQDWNERWLEFVDTPADEEAWLFIQAYGKARLEGQSIDNFLKSVGITKYFDMDIDSDTGVWSVHFDDHIATERLQEIGFGVPKYNSVDFKLRPEKFDLRLRSEATND